MIKSGRNSPRGVDAPLTPPKIQRIDNNCKEAVLPECIEDNSCGSPITPTKDLSKTPLITKDVTTRTLKELKNQVLDEHHSLDSQPALLELERIIEDQLRVQKSWKYPLYNELAKVKYKLGKFDGCIFSIKQAVDLVESSELVASKLSVYYNCSQFLSVVDSTNHQTGFKPTYMRKKSNLNESLQMITKVIGLLELTCENQDFRQDCLVQKASLLSRLGNTMESYSVYKESFIINPDKYIREYTHLGQEVLFFAVSSGDDWWLDRVIELMSINDNIMIDPNRPADSGRTALSEAIIIGSTKSIIEKLLRVGADPFLFSTLVNVLLNENFKVADIIFNFLKNEVSYSQDKDDYASILLSEMSNKSEFEEHKDKIIEFLNKYEITLFPKKILEKQENSNDIAAIQAEIDSDAKLNEVNENLSRHNYPAAKGIRQDRVRGTQEYIDEGDKYFDKGEFHDALDLYIRALKGGGIVGVVVEKCENKIVESIELIFRDYGYEEFIKDLSKVVYDSNLHKTLEDKIIKHVWSDCSKTIKDNVVSIVVNNGSYEDLRKTFDIFEYDECKSEMVSLIRKNHAPATASLDWYAINHKNFEMLKVLVSEDETIRIQTTGVFKDIIYRGKFDFLYQITQELGISSIIPLDISDLQELRPYLKEHYGMTSEELQSCLSVCHLLDDSTLDDYSSSSLSSWYDTKVNNLLGDNIE